MDGYAADASVLLCGAGGRMDIHQQHGRPHQQHVKMGLEGRPLALLRVLVRLCRVLKSALKS